MPGLFTGATGTWGGFAGLLYGSTSLSTPPGLLADAGGFSPASLFAAGEPGVWYDPSDFSTMFQDSVGTTPVTAVEQPVGLLLDKSQGLVLGPELGNAALLNKRPATDGTVTRSGGIITFASAASGLSVAISQEITGLTVGRTYRFNGRMRRTVGAVACTPQIRTADGGGGSGLLTGPNIGGDFTSFSLLWVATQTSAYFSFSAGATSQTIEVDEAAFSVKLLPGNHATQATSASRPVLSARVNLLTKTEQFDDAAWVKDRVTVSANATVAPDNTTTADKVSDTAVGFNSYRIYNSLTLSAIGYTETVYAKAAELSWCYIRIGNELKAWFDLANGVVGTVNSGMTSSIQSVGNGWYRLTATIATATAGAGFGLVGLTTGNGVEGYTPTGGNGIYIWGADLRVANDGVNLPVYQRVNTSTDYDTTGFPYYLRFDGSDDSMATNTITPGIDKAQVFAGVRKLSDAAIGTITELSAAPGNGSFSMLSPRTSSGATHGFTSRGTIEANATSPASYASPITNVLTGLGAISTDTDILRVNGVQAATSDTDQGTGNYLAYPLYIGRRGGTTLPLNGRIYSLITRFGANLDVVTINNTEVYVSGKMGGGYVSPITGYDFLVDANGDQITDASNNPLFTQALYT